MTISRLFTILLVFATLASPLLAQVEATIGVDEDRLQGTHPSGELMLNAPNPVQPGSSISHWDPSAFPNLLMEPSINADLPFLGLDVSPGQMEDIGWSLGDSMINIVPFSAPGGGFDDPRQVPGAAPGNPATTLGAARVNLINAVIGAWGSTLESDVPIDVLVFWVPQFCQEGGGAVLASAGTIFAFFDDGTDLPRADTWYHAALVEAIVGFDVTGGPPYLDADGNFVGGDIVVFINDDIDNECLGAGTSYYYGLDGNNPPNQIDLAPVVLHEIGHGLGMANFTSETTGNFFGTGSPDAPFGYPNVYDIYTFDHTQGRSWPEMTPEERVASAINFRQVTWTGANANAQASALLTPGVPQLDVTAPAEAAGTFDVGTATFGPPVTSPGVSGEIACMEDAVDLGVGDFTALNGCFPATNPGQLAGKIALIDRGACSFVQKVLNAEAAGATAVIISNVAGAAPITMGGDPDAPVGIPAVSVGSTVGNALREAACQDTAGFAGNNNRFQITAYWAAPDGSSGSAHGHALTNDTSWFYFFSEDNVELVVKVLDGCDINGHFWIFAAGLTNVEVTFIVIDTFNGATTGYINPQGAPFFPVQDTTAFATCP